MSAKMRLIAQIDADTYRGPGVQVEQRGAEFRIMSIHEQVSQTVTLNVATENLREWAEHIIDLCDLADEESDDD